MTIKKAITLLSALILASLPLSAGQQKVDTAQMEKFSEAFGHMVGQRLSAPGIELDLEAFNRGLQMGVNGDPAPMPSHEYERLMVRIQEQAEAQVAVENLAEAESFLKENAQRPGVVEIVPGQLQYRVVRQGQGMVVPDNGSPLVHYKGRFIDGSLFGSTEDDGEAMTIPLDQTISGFARAVAGMQEGEKREIYIHPELGYGTSGQLPPNALLIFEVSVVEAGEGALEAPENTPNAAGEEPLSEQAPRSTLPAMTLEEVAIELGIDPQDMDPAFQ